MNSKLTGNITNARLRRHSQLTLVTMKRSSLLTTPSLITASTPSPTSFSLSYKCAPSMCLYPALMAIFNASAILPGGDLERFYGVIIQVKQKYKLSKREIWLLILSISLGLFGNVDLTVMCPLRLSHPDYLAKKSK